MRRSKRRFFDGGDEWEKYTVSSHMHADIPRSPCAMPVAGLIFMCDSVVRACILRHANLRMPAGPKCINAARVRPGTKLFIFEVGCRILWGVYEVASPPYIIRRASFPEDKLPYQLYFRTIHKCQPLSEKVFKHAIKDNYYESHKFHFDLREDQVTKLMALYKEIKMNHKIVPVNTGKPQRVLSLDDFHDANKQAFNSSMINSFSFEDSKHCSPANCEGISQQDQCKDYLQVKPEGHLYACSINSSLSGRAHLPLNDELLNCDLKLGRTETCLICKPGCKRVLGSDHLQDYFEDPGQQGQPDCFSLEDGELLQPKSVQDLHGLHNVTLHLNIDVPVKDLGCGNFYEKGSTFDCKTSQGTDKYDLDLVKAVPTELHYSPAIGKTEILPDQNVYCDLHDKMVEKVHYSYGAQEDIELSSLRLASSPLPSAFSPPVAVSTRNFLEILEHTLTSLPKMHSTNQSSYFSTPDSTQQVANTGRSLAQNKGITNHAAHKNDMQVENHEHNLLAEATLGKRTGVTGASAVSCGGKKKKRSNWLHLSCPSPKQEMIL